MFGLRKIAGESMLPTLQPGRFIIYGRKRSYHVGDIVIIDHAGTQKIKRIADIQIGKVFLLGDNPGQSTDSRTFGWLDMTTIKGVVVWPFRHSRQ